MRINWRPYDTESGGGLLLDSTTGWDIPLDAAGNGQRQFSLNLDLSHLGSATRRIRFNAMAGNASLDHKFFVGTDYILNVHARTVTNPRTLGKGWYSDHGYTNPVLDSPIPGIVSGTYCPHVEMHPGGDGLPTVEHLVLIDPDIHMHLLGIVVLRAAGPYNGAPCIDTRTLANGPHKLTLIASDGHLAGVLVLSFEVRN
jgi:hypothetical protein